MGKRKDLLAGIKWMNEGRQRREKEEDGTNERVGGWELKE